MDCERSQRELSSLCHKDLHSANAAASGNFRLACALDSNAHHVDRALEIVRACSRSFPLRDHECTSLWDPLGHAGSSLRQGVLVFGRQQPSAPQLNAFCATFVHRTHNGDLICPVIGCGQPLEGCRCTSPAFSLANSDMGEYDVSVFGDTFELGLEQQAPIALHTEIFAIFCVMVASGEVLARCAVSLHNSDSASDLPGMELDQEQD